MTDLIDKKALLEALREEVHGRGGINCRMTKGYNDFLDRVGEGEFDATPEPNPPEYNHINERINSLEKFQKHIERQMQACLKDLNGGMQPGDKHSIHSRVMELERNKADAATLSGKAGDKLREDIEYAKRIIEKWGPHLEPRTITVNLRKGEHLIVREE